MGQCWTAFKGAGSCERPWQLNNGSHCCATYLEELKHLCAVAVLPAQPVFECAAVVNAVDVPLPLNGKRILSR